MRYLRTYEEFRFNEVETEVDDVEVQPETEIELSDTTIDDVLSDDFLKDIDSDEDNDDSCYLDNGVYHIKNWKVY